MGISENDLIEKYNNSLSKAGNLSEHKEYFPGSESHFHKVRVLSPMTTQERVLQWKEVFSKNIYLDSSY